MTQIDMQCNELSDIHLQIRRACHDLNAPLRAVRGFADILHKREADNLSERGRLYLQRMVGATEHMERVVEGLHQYGRLSTHSVQLKTICLQTFTNTLIHTYYPTATSTLRWHVDASLHCVSDPTLLQMIMRALIDNALLFCAPQTPPIAIVRWQATDAQLQLSVEDHGIGIASEHQQRIFNLFERMHNREQYPGAGTGLALVWKATALLNGTICVDSAVEQGTTITLNLPSLLPT